MKRPVKTKMEFVRRYKRGEFGNASPTWNSLAEFQASGYRQGPVHLRRRVAGGKGKYNVHPSDVVKEYKRLISQGIDPKTIYISAMAPHNRGTIQGEVRRDTGVLHLRYNTQKVPMREGFAIEDLCATGCVALFLLQKYLCGSSYNWLEQLLDDYPDHIIEFSAFEIPWGTLYPHYNTCFWEVRPDRGFSSNLSAFTEVY